MGFSLNKGLVKSAVALAVTTVTLQAAHAAPQDEINQLRAEIQELRSLIQQQNRPVANTAPAVDNNSPKPLPAPYETATSSVAPPPAAQFDPKNLKITTAKGAEVKLYGFVRGDANYIIEGSDGDFNGVASSKEEAKDKLRATAKTTRIGVDFNTPVGDAKVGGKLEADFSAGNSNDDGGVRIRHAYLTYNDWLFGQTTSNFLGSNAPEMIDFNTNIGGGTKRLPQVRYNYKLSPTTQVVLSLEKGVSTGESATTNAASIKYKLPAFTAKLNQSFAQGKGSASVRALAEQYDVNAGTGSNGSSETGWGVAAGANYQIIPELKLFGDVSHVKGNNSYLYGSNTSAAVYRGDVGLNEFNTFQVGGTYQILPKLRSTLAYGGMYADDDNTYAKGATGSNKEVQQAWINFIYSPAKPVELGLEYINGKRETFAGSKFDDNRVGLMAKYSF